MSAPQTVEQTEEQTVDPVLVVDDWRQLSEGLLERRYAELSERFRGGWERRWLFAEWWVERVRAAMAAGHLSAGLCDMQ